jgi:glycosyltransferase involved in cell wall biosynthesis
MPAAPRVSVVVPFFDAGPFLAEAIESVFAQTDDDWELLLVDDGSTDGSTEIALEYERRRPERVSYLSHLGRIRLGHSAARNVGLAHASGEYVALLDADDVWLPNKLREQRTILDGHAQVGMLYGRSEWWFSWTCDPSAPPDFTHELGVPSGTPFRAPSLIEPLFALQTAAIPNPSTPIIRRSVALDVGGFEESFRRIYGDQVFFAKICMNATVVAADSVWARYRQHPNSVTARVDQDGKTVQARADFLTWLIDYLKTSGFSDRNVYRALHRQRFLCAHPRLQRGMRRLARSR